MEAALCSLLASVRLIEGGALASLFLRQLCAQTPVPLRYSTHDWTRPFQNPTTQQWLFDYREAFADVKSPGDGRTYAVGTIEVKDTGLAGQALFSDFACNPSLGLPAFDNIFSTRQVVVLQVTDSVQPGTWVTLLTGHKGDTRQRFRKGLTRPSAWFGWRCNPRSEATRMQLHLNHAGRAG